jgi:hypothetical protein
VQSLEAQISKAEGELKTIVSIKTQLQGLLVKKLQEEKLNN